MGMTAAEEGRLVASVWGYGVALARRLAPSVGLAADEAEEVVGEALLRAVRAFDPGRGATLVCLATWRIRDALRSASRRHGVGARGGWWERSRSEQLRVRDQDADPEGAADPRGRPPEQLLETTRALERLDPLEADVLVSSVAGEERTSIGRRHGLSVAEVATVRFRAVRRFRRALSRGTCAEGPAR